MEDCFYPSPDPRNKFYVLVKRIRLYMTATLPPPIFTTGVELMPGVPLHVYGVKGPEYSVLIDTGIVQMKQAILDLCEQLDKPRLVLITHAHADHTGCNHSVKQATGALIAASGGLPWIENYDIHYQEFCLPEITLEYTPNQKDDVYGIVDAAVHVDMIIDDGNVFRLGNDIELHTIAVGGAHHLVLPAGQQVLKDPADHWVIFDDQNFHARACEAGRAFQEGWDTSSCACGEAPPESALLGPDCPVGKPPLPAGPSRGPRFEAGNPCCCRSCSTSDYPFACPDF